MNFEDAAKAMAAKVRSISRGFLSLRREEFRGAFEVGRLTEGQSRSISEALEREGMLVFPHPFENFATLRVYDLRHPLGAIAQAVAMPDAVPESALRRGAELFARDDAGRNLRSDDAPWIVVFELFLRTILARETTEWEDLRDDRHPQELARDLAMALSLSPDLVGRQSTLVLAAGVVAMRPPPRRDLERDLAELSPVEGAAKPLHDAILEASVRRRGEYNEVLRSAALLLRSGDEIPTAQVELGRIGLRYRREDEVTR